MDNLLKVIKSMTDTQIKAIDFSEYAVGTVVSENPLRIKISDRITIEEDMILLTEQVLEKKINLKHKHEGVFSLQTKITIQEGLKKSDRVHLIRVSKGQQFIVISKIRDKKRVEITKEDEWKWS